MLSTALTIDPSVLIKELPQPLRSCFTGLLRSESRCVGINAFMERWVEFGSPLRALLAGALVHSESRDIVNATLDREWAKNTLADMPLTSEIVIGSGIHAAIYCATRAITAERMGVPFVKPIVVEADARVGGTFARTQAPAWFLNSRNRAGGQGAPGEGGSLNMLPNAPVQPQDVCASEFQTNRDLGDVIRLTLAMYAHVIPNTQAREIRINDLRSAKSNYTVRLTHQAGDRRELEVPVVIVATGLGKPNDAFDRNVGGCPRILSYFEFMRRMDEPFPLRGLRRVAIIGGGDSGRTVAEALVGQGPGSGFSIPSLDRVERIDWYGIGEGMTEAAWCTMNRPRYRGLGRFLREDGDGRRIRPMGRAQYVNATGDVVYVNGRPYDHVIDATGFGRTREYDSINALTGYDTDGVVIRGVTVGRKIYTGYGSTMADGNGIYEVGPAARIAVERWESVRTTQIPENSAAIFRYAPRTAALAEALPFIEGPRSANPTVAEKLATAKRTRKKVAREGARVLIVNDGTGAFRHNLRVGSLAEVRYSYGGGEYYVSGTTEGGRNAYQDLKRSSFALLSDSAEIADALKTAIQLDDEALRAVVNETDALDLITPDAALPNVGDVLRILNDGIGVLRHYFAPGSIVTVEASELPNRVIARGRVTYADGRTVGSETQYLKVGSFVKVA